MLATGVQFMVVLLLLLCLVIEHAFRAEVTWLPEEIVRAGQHLSLLSVKTVAGQSVTKDAVRP